jgi:hypothetical protein
MYLHIHLETHYQNGCATELDELNDSLTTYAKF